MDKTENFVTLFDANYLYVGLSLYDSLVNYYEKNFCLWVICLDTACYDALGMLNRSQIKQVLLKDVETKDLVCAKNNRSWREYCWTLASQSFGFCWNIDSTISRLTYIDADVFFFRSPQNVFFEMEESKADVLITKHNYASEYDVSHDCGSFCVQFVAVNNSLMGRKIIDSWAKECLDWCYDKVLPDRFGDQKYLDKWPSMYEKSICILKSETSALGPWNIKNIEKKEYCKMIFYHFHGIKLHQKNRVILNERYFIPKVFRKYHKIYLLSINKNLALSKSLGVTPKTFPITKKYFYFFRILKRVLFKNMLEYKVL